MTETSAPAFIFDGFEPANTTPVPDILFDQLLAELNESELKVLLYIIRRTAGFKKPTDAISLNQFQKGIKKRVTGEILDRGCGIKDRATIIKALASLEKKGIIQADKSDDPQGDKATSVYRIRFRSEVVGKTNYPADIGSGQNQLPWFAKPTTGSGQNQPGVVGNSNPQETVIQSYSKQETEKQEDTYTERESQSHDTGAIAPTHTQVSPSEKTQQVATVRAHEPAPQAQLSTVAMSSPQACAKVEKRASGKKVVEPPAFTAEGQKVYDAWCSLFKSPPRAAEKTADCANDLYARLVPWCRELNISCKQLLSDIKGWCYATDPDWYRKKGVTLCDIGSQFERWQSARTEEMEQAKKPSILPKTPTGTVSGLKRWVAPAHMQQGG